MEDLRRSPFWSSMSAEATVPLREYQLVARMEDLRRSPFWSSMSAEATGSFFMGRPANDSRTGSHVSAASKTTASMSGSTRGSPTIFSDTARNGIKDNTLHQLRYSARCATPTQPQFGFDPVWATAKYVEEPRHTDIGHALRTGDIPSTFGSQLSSARSSSPRLLSAAALEERNASLLEELKLVEKETKEVKAETDSCMAGLPGIQEVVLETQDFLHTAQIELGHFESEIAKRSAKRLTAPRSSFSSETKLVEQQMQENLRLQQIVDKLETEHLGLQQQCESTNHNAMIRLDQTRFKIRQEIDRCEHEASQRSRALKDQLAREGTLRASEEERCARFKQKIEALRAQQLAAQNRNYRTDPTLAQEEWQAERKAMLQDIKHLEAHTAEVRIGTAQLQRSLAEEEEKEQARMTFAAAGRRDLHGLRVLNTETQEMQAMIDLLTQKANAAEQEVEELRDQQRALERRSMNWIRIEWEECAELEARAKGQVRAPRSLAEDSGLDAEDRAVGEEARRAREELYDAQSQAQRAEQGLREALSELQQQQDMLGHQLQSLQNAPSS